ncbi:MAG: hypothetical protein B7Y99_07445 [Caulobacterales bacterium 32-69-10]|nr:MAG: hypothetical protein B7Y99_07445 [Caulobacterales bacterium 32-69-10]
MPPSQAEPEPVLRISAVRAGYRGRPVLTGFDLTIGAGETFALLGPNGAGKSTVARVASGLMRPELGDVRLCGQNIWDGGAPARRIGLAPQECALFAALTIRENLSVMAKLGGGDRESRSRQVTSAIERTDCTLRADQRVATLSGGWKRRANLAAALVGRPALVVADEPTEGVDAPTRRAIATALRQTVADGAGCLLISHDPAFVEMAADRIGVMSEGRLIAEGAREALLRQTFGDCKLLIVRFDEPPPASTAAALAEAGMAEADGALSWRVIDRDVMARAQALSGMVDQAGGEMAIRKPGIDELVARLLERAA